jgi:hypothetical protein
MSEYEHEVYEKYLNKISSEVYFLLINAACTCDAI